MAPLRAGLDGFEPVGDGVVDGPVITELEMQEIMVFERSPVTAIKGLPALDVERPGDRRPVPKSQHKHQVFRHRRANQGKELLV